MGAAVELGTWRGCTGYPKHSIQRAGWICSECGAWLESDEEERERYKHKRTAPRWLNHFALLQPRNPLVPTGAPRIPGQVPSRTDHETGGSIDPGETEKK